MSRWRDRTLTLVVEGHWQDREGSFNLIAKRFENLSYMVDDLEMSSRDFQ